MRSNPTLPKGAIHKTSDMQEKAAEERYELLGQDAPQLHTDEAEEREKDANAQARARRQAEDDLADPNSDITKKIADEVAEAPLAEQRYKAGQLEREYIDKAVSKAASGKSSSSKSDGGKGGNS